jgi:O-antigen/teichoic acid export membrane protein
MKNIIKINYRRHKSTVNNFIWRTLQIFGKQGVTFLIFILCAKLLSPYDFGIYNYVLAIIFFLIIFGDFGISTATSKYVAEYNTTDKQKLKFVLFNSLIIIVSLGVVITLLTVLFGGYFLKEKYEFVLYALPLLFLAPISSLYDGIFRGLRRFKELAVISLSVGFFSIFFVYLLVKNFGLIGALISQNLFYFVLILSLFFVYKNLYFQFDKKLIKKIFNYSLIIGFTSTAYFLYTKVDILVLGHLGYIEEIGYYEIVNKIYELIKLPVLILAVTLAPTVTKYYAQEKYKIVKNKFIKHFLCSLIFGILLSILLYFVIPIIIKFFLSKYFISETILIFNLLLIILPIRIVATIVSQTHTIATGNAIFSLWTLIPAGITNLILDFIFIYKFGFIGVVYSTIICFTFANFSFMLLYYRKLNKLIE